ncbi:cytidylate kinase [uncultured Roseburia sp.]|uniref:Cytidylate kinase-like family protein n=1 Tax=Brotonthovivens ammoniilytica TaxID=2981725 RepID=A0ABT2TJK7_9FIRM|nr:cytidylate kinase-like family protein [Brotonthovivens ammoniilytica]MCU6762394.1 cytidylate kinase-like family protein [Brotonthovivens ammoniilytica]SCI70337.1 cytidylate kinase [uncultured Roseburia sp.]
MNEKKQDKALAAKIYELDNQIYQATGSTLGKVFPASRTISVNQIAKLLNQDKNQFLKNELILLSNMMKTLKDPGEYEKLLTAYRQLEQEIASYDPKAYHLTSGLEAISGACPVIPQGKRVIVCISRQYGCRGQEVGLLLAKRTHLTYYDKDILSMACQEYNLDENEVSDYNDSVPDAEPSRFPRLPKLGSVSHDALYFKERKIIKNIAENENCIFLGRCADHILDKLHIPHLSVYLCAPLEKRIQVEISRFDVSAVQAKKTILQVDRSRQAFYKYYTDRTWGNPELYNACLNTSIYGVEGTVELIENMIHMRYQPSA